MDTKNAYAVIKRARQILKSAKPRHVAQKTHQDYMNLGARVMNDKKLLKEARTANTYYKRLSAYNYCVDYSIRSLLAKQDREQKTKAHGWTGTVKRLERAIREYDEAQAIKGDKPTDFEPKQSKRKHVRGLPPQWTQQYWENVDKGNKYAPVIALLLISGVRPAELQKGVQITFHEKHVVLFVTIWGAKCRGDGSSGQKERVVAFDCEGLPPDSPEMFLVRHYLAQPNAAEDGVFIQANAKALYNYVSRLSRKIWPRRKHHVTPYTFRHILSATLKKSERFDDEMIAKVLGHASCRSQLEYGSVRQGGRGSSILDVRAEKTPRPHKNPNKNPR
ncbi:site-specific integrase [Desulfohalobium retbaense]|uniref:Tyr recombinase domain-containing protein n=1 Tax=Desulfohalobium retbaense (strain ATCC 49708 / DSM 5692 / JCM 16813 / HR100) TaxID=485915 RepID=C8X1F2_DESRD|nr:site-specific integrase [Desulfohalobium retbaense]ACV68249.1 hypothetical protein Dret_0961 [Desulfohalobium retbaense DSM 5692]